MEKAILDRKINKFWEWFTMNEHQFREVADPQAAVEAMDEHVLEFGLFSWEIGQGANKPYYLMISPNGDGRRLDISYRIMEAAPDLRDWEFRYCKPPQDWDFKFETYDKYLIKRIINAAEWEYVLEKTPDQLFEITICAANMSNIDAEDQLNVAEMVLTKTLGEEMVIDFLAALEVVMEFSPQQEMRCKKMPFLRKMALR